MKMIQTNKKKWMKYLLFLTRILKGQVEWINLKKLTLMMNSHLLHTLSWILVREMEGIEIWIKIKSSHSNCCVKSVIKTSLVWIKGDLRERTLTSLWIHVNNAKWSFNSWIVYPRIKSRSQPNQLVPIYLSNINSFTNIGIQ